MDKFERKHNYPKETIADVKKLISIANSLYKQDKLNMPVLAMPQKDSIICYYHGIVFAQMKDNNWEIGESFKNYINDTVNFRDYLLDKKNDYENLYVFLMHVEKHLEKQKERRCQQVISVKNIKPDPDAFSVCGFETKLPGTKGEIDMVIFNPSKHTIYLVEYKCTVSALNKNSVIEHTKDYLRIISAGKDDLVNGIVDAYNVLRQINGIHETRVDRNKINVKILFLFTGNNISDADIVGRERADTEIKRLYAEPAISEQDKQNIFWEYAENYKDYKFNPKNFHRIG